VISIHPSLRVNSGSLLLACTLAFLALAPGLARADRVVLYPAAGRADQERLEEIEQRISRILGEQGHMVVGPASAERPRTAAQREAAASATNAQFVVLAEVEPLRAQYRLHIEVYYRPNGRTEELVATVLESEEDARLSDILSSMVRREGLGEDAIRLTGGEPQPTEQPTEQETEEERQRREAEAAARREEEERARREAEEAAQREEEERTRREAEEAAQQQSAAERAWNERVRYETDGHWMVQVGAGGRYAALIGALPNPMAPSGGGLFDVSVRIGRTFDGVEGFELRGGIDVTAGALTGLGIHVGAAWLGSFFVEPVYIGLGGELGVIFTFTGSRDVGFSGRLGALFAWRPTEHIVIEASVPEIGILSPGAGAVTIGGSLRGAYRFD
jgi:hypothetical protein